MGSICYLLFVIEYIAFITFVLSSIGYIACSIILKIINKIELKKLKNL